MSGFFSQHTCSSFLGVNLHIISISLMRSVGVFRVCSWVCEKCVSRRYCVCACTLCFLLRMFSLPVCGGSQCLCLRVSSFWVTFCDQRVRRGYSEHVCVSTGCVSHMLAVLLPVCPSPGLVFSASRGVCEQVVSAFCVPTCGLMTSVCKQSCGSLFCSITLEFSVG